MKNKKVKIEKIFIIECCIIADTESNQPKIKTKAITNNIKSKNGISKYNDTHHKILVYFQSFLIEK